MIISGDQYPQKIGLCSDTTSSHTKKRCDHIQGLAYKVPQARDSRPTCRRQPYCAVTSEPSAYSLSLADASSNNLIYTARRLDVPSTSRARLHAQRAADARMPAAKPAAVLRLC